MNLLLRQSSSWDDIPQSDKLMVLIDEVGYGEPYYYKPEEIPPAKDWLPITCQDTNLIFTAWDVSEPSTTNLVGYCIMQPYITYPSFGHAADEYGVTAATCIYIAEFGIAESARGKRLGSILLDFSQAHCPAETSSYLVRTLVKTYGTDAPNPAVRFYKKKGFRVVEHHETGEPLIEIRSQRPRLFLRYDVRQP